jgi:hypothetical protein
MNLRPGTSAELGFVCPGVPAFIAFASNFMAIGDGNFS